MVMHSRSYIQNNSMKLTAKEIASIGMMVAIIEVSKVALMHIPNVELTSFWIIMFTLCFGKLVLFVIPVFILIEGVMFGFGIWWVMYLYAWPILALATHLLRKITSVWSWAMVSAVFGLSFGMMCALPYVVIGTVDGGLGSGLIAGFTWWVAGIPWDIVHGVANFVIMLVLYNPIKRVVEIVRKM